MDTSTRVESDLRKSGTEALREQEWIWEKKKRLEDNTEEALKCDSNDLSGLLAEGKKEIQMVANFATKPSATKDSLRWEGNTAVTLYERENDKEEVTKEKDEGSFFDVSEKDLRFICVECGVECKNKSHLRNHILDHYYNRFTPYIPAGTSQTTWSPEKENEKKINRKRKRGADDEDDATSSEEVQFSADSRTGMLSPQLAPHS